MKTFTVIILNILFLVISLPLMLVFLGVFGLKESIIAGIIFGISAGFLIPKWTKSKNNIDE